MPVAEFPGHHGWGYDGVYLSAAHSAYGGPHGLARLVDAAHAAGLGVILDVVYNHVGASGVKALEAFGPYFTERYETPWGKAVNFDDEGSDARPRVGAAERRGLGARLPRRRPAPRRDPRHPRRRRPPRARASWPSACTRRDRARAGHRRERPERPEGHPPGAPGRLRPRRRRGPTTSTTRCTRCSPASARAGTRSSARSAQLAKAFHRPHVHDGGYSTFRGRRFGAPRRRPRARAVRRLRPEPRPGRQPRLRRPAARARRGRWPRSARCWHPSPRCCSWARSTASARRSSSSPTTSTSGWPTRPARGAAGSSPPSPSSPARRSPTRRTRRPSSAPSSRAAGARSCARSTPRCCARAARCRRRRRQHRVRRGRRAGCACAAAPSSWRATSRAGARTVPVDGARGRRSPRTARRCGHGGVRLPARAGALIAMSDRAARSGPARRSRSARPGTARARTSRSSPSTPSSVELCLFDEDGHRGARRRSSSAPPTTGTATCPASGPASATATASTAATRPQEGHRFNPAKLLHRPLREGDRGRACDWDAANVLPYTPDDTADADLEPDDEDDADAIPKSRRRRPRASTGRATARRARPWHETVIYETHVKGFTKRHPDVREDLRGTYAGLASEPALALPQAPRRHRRRAAAGPPHRRRVLPARPRA